MYKAGGGMGLFHSYKQLYISHKLHEAKKPGKFFSRKSWVSHVASSPVCWFNSIYLIKFQNSSSGDHVLLIQDSNMML
jgi:hypothetical protein